jgi:uncharacterized membrane protein YeiH
VSLLALLDLVGIFVFGLSGGLLAVRKEMDVFGVAVLALAAALGGGLVRDVLLGAVPPEALTRSAPLAASLLAAAVAIAVPSRLERGAGTVQVFDAVGLGIFAVYGASKALDFGLGAVPATLLGVVTAIGGGVLRDVLAAEIPLVLRREIYALAALLGAGLAVAAARTVGLGPLAATLAASAAIALRLAALRGGWNAPRPRL